MHSSNKTVTLCIYSLKGLLVAVKCQCLGENCALHENFIYYAGIMFDLLLSYYAQNYLAQAYSHVGKYYCTHVNYGYIICLAMILFYLKS